MAVGDAFKAAIVKAGLDAARQSAEQLAKALQDARAAADALKPPPTPSQAAANEVRRLATEARSAASAYDALAKAQARSQAAGAKAAAASDTAAWKALNSFSAGGGGSKSPWAGGAGAPKIHKLGQGTGGAQGKKAAEDATSGPSKAAASAFHAPKDLKYLLKHAGIGKAAMGALGAAAGLELTKLALGYRGIAMLGAVSQRAGMQVRQLFSGVDPKPVVRAFDTLTNQILNKGGPSGKALASIFDHVFNGLFGGVEKAEPAIQAFFEYAIVGALKLETAYYELRTATLPLSDAFNEISDALSGVDWSGGGGGVSWSQTVREVATVAHGAAEAVRALTSALNAYEKGTWGTDAKERLGLISPIEAARERARAQAPGAGQGPEGAPAPGHGLIATGLIAAATAAGGESGKSLAEGLATGYEYMAGMAKGAAAGAPAAAAAAAAGAAGMNDAARGVLKIKSPSKVGEETGGQYPAGLAKGAKDRAPEAQDAMAAAAAPPKGEKPEGGAGGGGFPAEALALLRQIEINTRGRASGNGGGARSAGWGDFVHTLASVSGVSTSLGSE